MATGTPIVFVVSLALSAAVIGALWWKDVIRPTSLDRARDVSKIPTPVWLLCAAMVYLAQMEAGMLMLQWKGVGTAGSVRHEALLSIPYHLAGLVVGGLMVFLLRARAGARAGLEIGARDVIAGTLAMLMAAPVCVCVSIVCEWIAGAGKNDVAHSTLRTIIDNRGSPWEGVLILGAVVAAPIVEEIVYRGLLQSCLLNALGSAWGAIIGTSAIFAAMHWIGGGPVPWYVVPVLFVLSVAMGVAYERTRRLGVPMTMHALFNLGNVVIGMAMHPR